MIDYSLSFLICRQFFNLPFLLVITFLVLSIILLVAFFESVASL